MHPDDTRYCSCLNSCNWDPDSTESTCSTESAPSSPAAANDPAVTIEEARVVRGLLQNLRQLVPRVTHKSNGNDTDDGCDCITILHDATSYIQILQNLISRNGRGLSCDAQQAAAPLLSSTFVAKICEMAKSESFDDGVGRH